MFVCLVFFIFYIYPGVGLQQLNVLWHKQCIYLSVCIFVLMCVCGLWTCTCIFSVLMTILNNYFCMFCLIPNFVDFWNIHSLWLLSPGVSIVVKLSLCVIVWVKTGCNMIDKPNGHTICWMCLQGTWQRQLQRS